jgi:hypothetical protein
MVSKSMIPRTQYSYDNLLSTGHGREEASACNGHTRERAQRCQCQGAHTIYKAAACKLVNSAYLGLTFDSLTYSSRKENDQAVARKSSKVHEDLAVFDISSRKELAKVIELGNQSVELRIQETNAGESCCLRRYLY